MKLIEIILQISCNKKFKYDPLVEKICHLWMLTLMKIADYELFDNKLLKITIDSKEAMNAMKQDVEVLLYFIGIELVDFKIHC